MAQSGDYAEVTYKILLIGNAGVGKTALIKRLVNQEFSTNYMYTIGMDFVRKTFEVDGAIVKLEIWDTAGQERFRSITKFQYRGTKGILLVYDITSRSSFEMLNYWIDSIEKEFDKDVKTSPPVFIVGNKCDLGKELRQINKMEGQQVADRYMARSFRETSAKDGTNVFESFSDVAHTLTDFYNPRLMNGHLNPNQRKERRVSQQEAIRNHEDCRQVQTNQQIRVNEESKQKVKTCCQAS